MSEDKKHIKVTNYEEQEDGSIKIVTESYFEELASRKEDVVKSIKTDHNNLLSDVITHLDVINKKLTKELHLIITMDEWNQPKTITKQYTVKKESFKRR